MRAENLENVQKYIFGKKLQESMVNILGSLRELKAVQNCYEQTVLRMG